MQTTKRRSAQFWLAAVSRFAQSGLTEDAFCEREGLGVKLFHRWRSKRGRVVARTLTDKASPRIASASAGFVDLGSLKSASARLEMRLDLGGGVLLHVVRG